MRPLLVLAVLAGLGLTAPVEAQRSDDADIAAAIGSLWRLGDAGGLVRLGADPGLRLEIEDVPMGTLGGRRAAAALRQLFRGQQTVEVQPGPLTLVAGTDDRAFIELEWWARPVDGVAVERTTVFVGLVREPAGWKVSQIRVLPW